MNQLLLKQCKNNKKVTVSAGGIQRNFFLARRSDFLRFCVWPEDTPAGLFQGTTGHVTSKPRPSVSVQLPGCLQRLKRISAVESSVSLPLSPLQISRICSVSPFNYVCSHLQDLQGPGGKTNILWLHNKSQSHKDRRFVSCYFISGTEETELACSN